MISEPRSDWVSRITYWICACGFAIGTLLVQNLPARAQSSPGVPNAARAVTNEPESDRWEEPSLFPTQSDAPRSPRINRRDESGAVTEPAVESPAPESTERVFPSVGAASAFQPASANYALPSEKPVGLGSSLQRDLIRAQAERSDVLQPYNIKLGPIPFRLAADLDLEYTDNSLRSEDQKDADFLIFPRIAMTGFIRLAPSITLSLEAGIGYIGYLNQTQPDRVIPIASVSLNPEAGGLSLNLKIGKFLINLHDRPSVPRFAVSAVTQRDQFQFNSFTNTAGVTILWDVNSRVEATMGYDHTNQIALNSSGKGLDQTTENFFSSLSWRLSDALGVGLDAGLSTIKYTEDLLNNGTNYHFGPTFQLRLSNYLSMEGAFGYQGGVYDSNGQTGDSSNLGSYFFNVGFQNNLNLQFRHTLSFGHEAEQGVASNFTESNYIRYQASWDAIRKVNLSFFASFVDAAESGGVFAEHFRYYEFGLVTGFQLTQKIAVSLTYQFTKRETLSDEAQPMDSFFGRSLAFSENRVSLHLGYAF